MSESKGISSDFRESAKKVFSGKILWNGCLEERGDEDMPATRDGKLWRSQFYYKDWQGVRRKKNKRGFKTKGEKVKDAIRVITCRKSAYEGLEQKVEKLNPLIRGWRNYFQHGNSTRRFKQLDEYVWMRLWRRVYYRRKQKKYREHVLYGFRKWYATSGIEYFYYLNKKRYVAVF